MLDMPSIVTPGGDISVHGREGFLLTLDFESDTGLPRDMTSTTVTFETPYFSKQLTPGDQPSHLVLSVAPGELPNTVGRLVDFIVREETGAIPHVIWSGKLIMTGWVQ